MYNFVLSCCLKKFGEKMRQFFCVYHAKPFTDRITRYFFQCDTILESLLKYLESYTSVLEKNEAVANYAYKCKHPKNVECTQVKCAVIVSDKKILLTYSERACQKTQEYRFLGQTDFPCGWRTQTEEKRILFNFLSKKTHKQGMTYLFDHL